MVAIIKYKNKLRVVFILGRDKGKLYVLSSEQIPEPLAAPLSKILYGIESLGKRIEVLKDEFTPIYKSALRILDADKTVVVESYDKPKFSGRP